jgi:hypothetical protein
VPNPTININNFPGEYSAPNPQNCPPGAAYSIVNGALRQQGTIEADRGYAGLALPGSVVPTSAQLVDSHNSLWSSSTGATLTPTQGTQPLAQVVAVSPNSLQASGFLTSQCLIPWGWDAGIQDPLLGQYYLGSFAMEQTGWLATNRGLCKVEQLANLQLPQKAPLYQQTTINIANGVPGEPTVFNTTLIPPSTGDAAVSTNQGFSGIWAQAGTGGAAVQWLQAGYSVAYRLVVARKDENGYFQFSEPSSRILYTNSGGSANNPELLMSSYNFINLPPDAFIQIYRAQSVPAGITPSDEMYLVQELPPPNTAASTWGYTTWAAGGMTQVIYQDISPDTQIYVPLYTNAGLGNGIQSSNTPAPVANVVFTFGNRVYYGDTNSQQSLLILLAGVTAPAGGGLQVGDSLIVDGLTYTGVSGASGVGQFNVFTAGTPSSNVRLTAIALVDAINYTSNSQLGGTLPSDQRLIAQYISLGNGDEGQILIRRLLPGGPAFTVQTSATRGWAQNYTTPTPSNSSPSPGGLYWSKFNQPQHVPIAQNVVLGSAGAHVLAACALRDYAIIFKEDGAWTVQETSNGPAFAPLDSTVHVEAPRTVVAVQNTCFALTSKGVLAVGQYGTENISIPIQREIQSFLTSANTTIFRSAFAIAYESEAEYWLFLPSAGSSTCYKAKVYNLKTKSWRTAVIANFQCGLEGHLEQPNLRVDLTPLMLGTPSGWAQGTNTAFSGILVERKSYTNSDQQWDALTPVMTDGGNQNNGTYVVTVPAVWNGLIGRGDLLYITQSGLMNQYIIQTASLNSAQTTVSLTFNVTNNNPIGSLANISIIPCVQSTITFLPEDADQPLLSKHWSGSGCLIWNRYFSGLFFDVGWSTELSPLQSIGTVFGDAIVPWGPRPWCKTPWLSQDIDWIVQATITGQDVRGAQLVATLYYYNALTSFQLSSFTYEISGLSDRSVRS